VTGPFRIFTGFPILPDLRGTARYSVSKRTVARRKMPVKVYLGWGWLIYLSYHGLLSGIPCCSYCFNSLVESHQPAKLPKAAPNGKIGVKNSEIGEAP